MRIRKKSGEKTDDGDKLRAHVDLTTTSKHQFKLHFVAFKVRIGIDRGASWRKAEEISIG